MGLEYLPFTKELLIKCFFQNYLKTYWAMIAPLILRISFSYLYTFIK